MVRGSKIEVKCKRCKEPFLARVADRKRGWGKFCSKSCKAKRQEARTGQYKRYKEAELVDYDSYESRCDDVGHVFASGYFGHGQE